MIRETKTELQKTIEKADKQGEAYCRLCGRDIYGYESALFAMTKRKSICLFHKECIVKEARATKGRKTLHFTEAIIR